MDVQRPKRPRKRVRPNRKAQDQRIILMWIKRITTYRATIARVTAAK